MALNKNLNLEKNEIKEKIYACLIPWVQDKNVFKDPNIDEVILTSNTFGMDARKMLYFSCAVVNEFKLNMTSEDLMDYSFATIKNIVELIYSKLKGMC